MTQPHPDPSPREPLPSRVSGPRRLLVVALCLAALLVWPAVGMAQGAGPQAPAATATATATEGVSVVDDLGREVVLTVVPSRIVALAPSHAESVCAIASCASLVAVDTNTDFPAELDALPRVGNAFTPDVEAIVALEPDLVLADEYSGVHEALERLGITVYAGTPQTVEETFEYLVLLGEMLGETQSAASLVAQIQADIEEVGELLGGVERPLVFVELDPTPYSAGPASYIGTLLSIAGGENVVTPEMDDFPQVDPEFVVASDPDVVLLLDAPFGETAESVAARPGWSALAAVRDGRVVELTVQQANVLSRAGPRLGDGVWLLAFLLHPDIVGVERLSPELVGGAGQTGAP